MTPAKLFILVKSNRERLAFEELPIAALTCLTANLNRNPGDESKGIPAAPPQQISEFQVYKSKRGTLAAKGDDRPGGSHVLHGAKADRGAWEAYTRGKSKPRVVKVKREQLKKEKDDGQL